MESYTPIQELIAEMLHDTAPKHLNTEHYNYAANITALSKISQMRYQHETKKTRK